MTHSREHVRPDHHEKHIARNGQYITMKKMGAGHANWGVEGDEIPDVYEYARQHTEKPAKFDKVNIVDPDTFLSMRSE